jgi:A-factor biosynthesis hotdog domain
MNTRAFFVVGEKFQEFARGKDVLTIGQLKGLARLPNHVLDSHNVLMLGQGVPQEDVLSIIDGHRNSTETSPRFEISDLMRVLDRAAPDASHKATPHNTLIGTPRRNSDDTFEVPFNLDERCELMGDHQTGQHLQGMLLVEAFRQSFLAVTETFFPFGQGKRYFVINSMHVDFQNFMFPLPAHINYQILESDVTERRARYKTTLAAMQNGDQCASASIAFTVYPAEVIAKKEAEMAGVLTEKMLAARRLPVAVSERVYSNGHGKAGRESEL